MKDERICQDFESAFLPLTAEARWEGNQLCVEIQDHERAFFSRLGLHNGEHLRIIETYRRDFARKGYVLEPWPAPAS